MTKIDLIVRVQIPTVLPRLVQSVKDDLKKAGWSKPQVSRLGKSTYLVYAIKANV